nr:uncharacterized protein LOC129255680 [Lytechinus pictus]
MFIFPGFNLKHTSSEPRRRSRTAPAVITRNMERPCHQNMSMSSSSKGKLSITVNMDPLISSSIESSEQAEIQENEAHKRGDDIISLHGNVGSSESLLNYDNSMNKANMLPLVNLPVYERKKPIFLGKPKCVGSMSETSADDVNIDRSEDNQDQDQIRIVEQTVLTKESTMVDPFERLLKGLREPRFRRLVARDDGADDVANVGDVDNNDNDINCFEKDLDLAIEKLEQLRSNFVNAAGLK